MSERELERVLRNLSSLMDEMRDDVRSRGGKNTAPAAMRTPALREREEAGASAQTSHPRECRDRFHDGSMDSLEAIARDPC